MEEKCVRTCKEKLFKNSSIFSVSISNCTPSLKYFSTPKCSSSQLNLFNKDLILLPNFCILMYLSTIGTKWKCLIWSYVSSCINGRNVSWEHFFALSYTDKISYWSKEKNIFKNTIWLHSKDKNLFTRSRVILVLTSVLLNLYCTKT